VRRARQAPSLPPLGRTRSKARTVLASAPSRIGSLSLAVPLVSRGRPAAAAAVAAAERPIAAAAGPAAARSSPPRATPLESRVQPARHELLFRQCRTSDPPELT